MKNFIKVTLLFILLVLLSSSAVFAVGIDMNLNNIYDTSNDTQQDENLIDNVTGNTYQNSSSSSKISTTQTSDDFELTVSDIINIILIAVGIVIIFLAIAILLKLR